jgi:hypothetical protein
MTIRSEYSPDNGRKEYGCTEEKDIESTQAEEEIALEGHRSYSGEVLALPPVQASARGMPQLRILCRP